MSCKSIAVLGCTGSIGRQALSVIRTSPERFSVTCICADKSVKQLADLANEFMPPYVGIRNEKALSELRAALNYSPEILCGDDAAATFAALDCVDVVVNGISGIVGLPPLVSAIESGKVIAAANKESIVCGHGLLEKYRQNDEQSLVMPLTTGARIIPVDSEQSAIFQCLTAEPRDSVEALILTASGGAFRDLPAERLQYVTVGDALSHPTWKMGSKITIDSATLFNKGLEVMEAAYLFGMEGERIEVLIHPESIVHSMVRFRDGTVKAQLSVPDMRDAIQYAMTYPSRHSSPVAHLDLCARPLSFFAPDCEKYPSLPLAFYALSKGGALPIVYNSANEAAVQRFVTGEIRFTDIYCAVEYAMNRTEGGGICACVPSTLSAIMEIGKAAEHYAREYACRTP